MSETVESAESVETDRKGAPRPKETLRRLVQGDLASLRVVIGLALIWAIFQFENDRFLSAQNLTNLGLQITAIGLISVGIVYVLLLGEIDLSVGAVSGLAAAVMAVLNVKHGWSPYLAIVAAVAVGCAIGLLQGALFTRFGIPSFVVTLAGLLAWQGALLQVLGSTGSLNITDPKITGLANTFYSDTTGWVFLVVGLVAYVAVLAFGYRRRVAAGLAGQGPTAMIVRFVGVAAVAIAAVLVFNSDRGVPLALLILLGFVIGMEYVVKRTRFGRHVFAVGGNAEAARRAGISVSRVRIAVFAIAGTMAAIGGVMAASRLLAVNQNSGGNELLLLAIAGPVIAGTSLFGGRGSVWTALLGALVIGSISNGMDLLALSSAVKFMVTGGVLLLAVIVDAIARQQREASGRL
ncbi:MAG: D-xylose transport system permease protein [Solirubrobacterales bacterium]|jgi:D-xylose transport system permease protein|nr:D-xylose transport system permease protein [Solirubrobacterales bacterium]